MSLVQASVVFCNLHRIINVCFTVFVSSNRFFSLESRDPSWVELYRFTSFLDTQLKASEHSIYCDESIVGDASQGVYGFKSFVVKFMIRMSVVSLEFMML